VEVLPDEVVRRFIGTYKPQYSLLDVDNPVTYGPMDFTDYFFEHKRQQVAALEKALEVIPAIGEEYGQLSGRYYGLIEPYKLDDADYAIIILGSTAGVVRLVVDELRLEGIRAGMLKIRCFRPFPAKAVVDVLAGKKAIAVMDRSISFGAQANPLFLEVCTSLYTYNLHSKVVNYVYGLGGRDTVPSHVRHVYDDLMQVDRSDTIGPVVRYLGIRD
jgi:pyruvate ferredoxin oxidoreductase alpha subunit